MTLPKIDIIELHMASAHFPIGLLLASVLFDAAGRGLKKQEFLVTSYWTHLMGVLSGVVTLLLGIIGNPFREDTGWLPVFWVNYGNAMANKMVRHQWIGTLSLILFAILVYFRIRRKHDFTSRQPLIYGASMLIAAGLLGLAGYLGAHVMD